MRFDGDRMNKWCCQNYLQNSETKSNVFTFIRREFTHHVNLFSDKRKFRFCCSYYLIFTVFIVTLSLIEINVNEFEFYGTYITTIHHHSPAEVKHDRSCILFFHTRLRGLMIN